MTIYDTLARLVQAFKDVKAALVQKGATVTDADGLEDLPAIIGALPDGNIEIRCVNPPYYLSLGDTVYNNITFWVDSTNKDLSSATNALKAKNKITLKCTGNVTSYNYALRNASCKTIELNFGGCHVIGSLCNNNANLLEVIGTPLNGDNSTADMYLAPFNNCPNLREFRVDPNSIKVNFYINHSAVLSNDTVVSLANGLNSFVTGKSIRLNTAIKTRISAVVGNVVDSLFVIDEAGSVSLTDYITTMKGWSIQWWA